MSKNFYQKTGVVIEQLANEIYQLQVGDRMPSIRELQERFDCSRGTVQNAIAFLKEESGMNTESKGQLGTFLTDIQYTILQGFISSSQLSGTMPLPYSRLYEGLATGLYFSFRSRELKLNLAYVRGSEDRIRGVEQGTFDFAVVSRFAAEHEMKKSRNIKIIQAFGPSSYLSKHILVFRPGLEPLMTDGLRVGIDHDSLDHRILTKEVTEGYNVEEVELPSNQLVFALRENQVDVGVWNYDEIVDKRYEDVSFSDVLKTSRHIDMSEAVIICQKNNTLVPSTFKRVVEEQEMRRIQKEVLEGRMTPRY